MSMFNSVQIQNSQAIVSPLALPGLAVWSKATKIVGLNDNDPISQWDDLSGNSRHFTQATAGQKPLYKTNLTRAGLPGVRFDGVDDFLSSAFAVGVQDSSIAVAFIIRASLAVNSYVAGYDQDAANFARGAAVSGLVPHSYEFDTGARMSQGPALTVGDLCILIADGRNNTVTTAWVNGYRQPSVAVGTLFPNSNKFCLGSHEGMGPAQVDILEVCVYSPRLDFGQDQLSAYLAAAWR